MSLSTCRITAEHFARLFQTRSESLDPRTVAILDRIDSSHRAPTHEEFQEYIHQYLKLLRSETIRRDDKQNYEAWLRGWTENLEAIKQAGVSEESLRPRYFRPAKFLRLDRSVIVSPNPLLEYDLFVAARTHLFLKHLSSYDTIYEIGCGSCGNVWLLSQLFPGKTIIGLDWVQPSADIANLIGTTLQRKVYGGILNMLEPAAPLDLPPNSALITIHAMEQIGIRHGPLIDCMLASRPAFVLHLEPILDFYDPCLLLDDLALWYCQKRQYLEGFLPALRAREKEGRIAIEEAYRPCLGGVWHEMSVVTWKPGRKS